MHFWSKMFLTLRNFLKFVSDHLDLLSPIFVRVWSVQIDGGVEPPPQPPNPPTILVIIWTLTDRITWSTPISCLSVRRLPRVAERRLTRSICPQCCTESKWGASQKIGVTRAKFCVPTGSLAAASRTIWSQCTSVATKVNLDGNLGRMASNMPDAADLTKFLHTPWTVMLPFNRLHFWLPVTENSEITYISQHAPPIAYGRGFFTDHGELLPRELVAVSSTIIV